MTNDISGSLLQQLMKAEAEVARLRSLIGRYGRNVEDYEGVLFHQGGHLTYDEAAEIEALVGLAKNEVKT